MMKLLKSVIFLFGVIFLQALFLSGHSYKVPVIIDTDTALDDARALVMLLNQDMCDILLTVTSDGAVSPETGRRNLLKLYHLFKKSNLTVAAGRELYKDAPPWRSWTENILFFDKSDAPVKKEKQPSATEATEATAAEAIVKVLRAAETPCVYLCLGPLTNLGDALKMYPGIKKKISRVIYYGTSPREAKLDWNTERDLPSALRVFDSGLRMVTLSSPNIDNLKFDMKFFEKIKVLDTPASRVFVKLHKYPAVEKLLSLGHFRIWDEIAVIYLNDPGLFQFTPRGSTLFKIKSYEAEAVYKSYIKLLGHTADSHLKEREVVVLGAYPVDPGMFKPDVEPYVKKIIERHGMEEWKACLLTNELHRHLGTYSIIGAKMGIRAREILDAPLDGLEVVSFAGSRPPMSCVNDGLQVSTGASLGRGTIKLSPSKPEPAAMFIYKDQKVTLRIKGEIIRRIKADIEAALKKYGGLGPDYFAHIRRLSIRYWHDFDRMKIFDMN
jgi:pyrimidine-specific ribonucleoside hydrolase